MFETKTLRYSLKYVLGKVSKTLAKMQRNRLMICNFTRNDINHKYFDFSQKSFY